MAKKRKHSEESAESCKGAGKVWVKSVKRTPHCRGARVKKAKQSKERPVSNFQEKVATIARDVEKDKKLPVAAAKVVTLARDIQKDNSLPMMAAKVLYKDGKKVEKEKRKIDKVIKLSKRVKQRLSGKEKVFRPLEGVKQDKRIAKRKKMLNEVRELSLILARRPDNKDIGKLAKLLERKEDEPKPVSEVVNIIAPRRKPKA